MSGVNRNAVMGRDNLPVAADFHPHVGQAITIFIGGAFRSSLFMICASNDRRVPMRSVAEWLRLNCTGGWRHVLVPGGDVYFCMDDPECARLFRVKFGRIEYGSGSRAGG